MPMAIPVSSSRGHLKSSTDRHEDSLSDVPFLLKRGIEMGLVGLEAVEVPLG